MAPLRSTGRRLVAQGLATWLCSVGPPSWGAAPQPLDTTPRAPVALALILPGFLLPQSQYASYAGLMEELGIRCVTFTDGSTLREPASLDAASARALAACEAEASRLGMPQSTPLVLVGHSRGCKECVLAAAKSTRPVAALILLDPVDSTVFEKDSTLPVFSTLRVPTLILGSGVGSGDCAPLDSAFPAFYGALAMADVPRLLGYMPRAGHTQFLDEREKLIDVCSAGSDDDESIREVAIAAAAAWCARYVPGVSERLVALRALGLPVGSGLTSAGWILLAEAVGRGADIIATLASRRFRAAVEWKAGGLKPMAPSRQSQASRRNVLRNRKRMMQSAGG